MQAAAPFVVIQLKPDWRFEGDGLAFSHLGRRLWLQVPSGTRLSTAAAGRVVYLRPDGGATLPELTALAAGWPCAERVDIALDAA